ncbi:UDP-glucose/hexose-1-phosphate uridylyltransferase [Elusimicrobium minutum Pei191]|uniref:Galactose-1-phosphate uridylyltransferase n=1 Tax=Elusimicrobium minutum (strain Pei191) TaxID=445932 RepID=B2KC35_ELUMP|nr:UDP-glucose--hexose-1-phosphate uridylyltransferase [Elusimicrobium minutum]ACC98162.1 UDP-glucose/hexose-1-phosphate uridylyltransferase [Elusimicrobium minutum Pei191]
MTDINKHIQILLNYAGQNGLISKEDKVWAANQIAAVLNLDSFEPQKVKTALPKYPGKILAEISDWAVTQKLIQDLPVYREMLETKIMGILIQRPSDFIISFNKIKKQRGIKAATDWMYKKQEQANYIKTERVAKNLSWKTRTKYGALDITVNLSKPEKDPKEIALLKTMGAAALHTHIYPKCLLCYENEGYAGRLNHPARQNIRLIPLNLSGETWYLQYSPYVYYNQHCIVLGQKHENMLIDHKTFERLGDFLSKFPHYFIGSNADLPIVGGSILNHDHYQGGLYTFPMHKAKERKTFKLKKWPSLKCATLNWPLSVIRLTGNKKDVLAASKHIFDKWIKYSDENAKIKSHTGKKRHNTVTPMAKMNGKKLQMDLALRNNRTSAKYPDGIFHSCPEFHHIKRENIGLIEVMGMAILPGRLKEALKEIGDCLINGNLEKIKKSPSIENHYEWAKEIYFKHKFTAKNAENILREETGKVFAKVLECCGVFKQTPEGDKALDKFLKELNK